MTALITNTGSRVTRFFRRVTKAGKYRWYDCDAASRGM